MVADGMLESNEISDRISLKNFAMDRLIALTRRQVCEAVGKREAAKNSLWQPPKPKPKKSAWVERKANREWAGSKPR